MKTSELTGAALDWAVTKCETGQPLDRNGPFLVAFKYSTDWSQGGPIIERERITLLRLFFREGGCRAKWNPVDAHDEYDQTTYLDGPTPLIAAMRCFVASKLGDTVDVPEELK